MAGRQYRQVCRQVEVWGQCGVWCVVCVGPPAQASPTHTETFMARMAVAQVGGLGQVVGMKAHCLSHTHHCEVWWCVVVCVCVRVWCACVVW